MTYEERKEQVKSYLGKTVKIEIDRPLGHVHKKERYSLTYPLNYGYIPGVLGGDGEELDVYLLGVEYPLKNMNVKSSALSTDTMMLRINSWLRQWEGHFLKMKSKRQFTSRSSIMTAKLKLLNNRNFQMYCLL